MLYQKMFEQVCVFNDIDLKSGLTDQCIKTMNAFSTFFGWMGSNSTFSDGTILSPSLAKCRSHIAHMKLQWLVQISLQILWFLPLPQHPDLVPNTVSNSVFSWKTSTKFFFYCRSCCHMHGLNFTPCFLYMTRIISTDYTNVILNGIVT